MSDSHERPVGFPARPAAPRRRWGEAEERRIVAESYQAGVSVSLVARRRDMNANLLFTLPPPPDAGSGAVPAAGRMEIALSDGSRVIVDREVDGAALGRVLSALARR